MAFAASCRRPSLLLNGPAVSWCSSLSQALDRRAPTLLDGAADSWCRSFSQGPLCGSRPAREEEYQRSPLPNVAAHFAELTNAVLQRIKDEEVSDKLYDEFMQGAKRKLICNLKTTYKDLHDFHANPSKILMPSWLSRSPPVINFYTTDMDTRLLSRRMQLRQDLRTFLEELGFVCVEVRYSYIFESFEVTLDVSTVPTTEANKDVENKLLTLERVLQLP